MSELKSSQLVMVRNTHARTDRVMERAAMLGKASEFDRRLGLAAIYVITECKTPAEAQAFIELTLASCEQDLDALEAKVGSA